MKNIITLIFVFTTLNTLAQRDTVNYDLHKADTTRIGNILWIKMHRKGDSTNGKTVVITKSKKSNSKLQTSWMAFDLGFSNYNDKTNYAAANNSAYLINQPGASPFTSSDFKPKPIKSINVNIWFVMQQLALIKNNVNLKYGVGLELNNYRFSSPISYRNGGAIPYASGLPAANHPFVFRDSVSFSKNKLALDYLAVPVMLNFVTNDQRISASFGVSGGYLYSNRNKQRSSARKLEKEKGDLGFKKFKLSYTGEIGMNNISLYGTYCPKSIYENTLDVRPFNLGFRFNFF